MRSLHHKKSLSVAYTILCAATFAGCSSLSHSVSYAHAIRLSVKQEKKLLNAGLSPQFINHLNSLADDSLSTKIIELNVLGFLSKADYSGHYSPKALRSCQDFIEQNSAALIHAEKIFDVQKEALTAVLWVETKHGQYLGKFNVPNVYLQLFNADEAERVRSTIRAARERSDLPEQELRKKVKERSEIKSRWALEQLKALEGIYSKRLHELRTLQGSFAGAFGIPQFIPSSYVQWAKSTNSSERPNLFAMPDAILSVASYLHAQGWKNDELDSQVQALYHYNRSKGYGEVVLKIKHELLKSSASTELHALN